MEACLYLKKGKPATTVESDTCLIYADTHLLTARPGAEVQFLIYPWFIFCCFVCELNETSAQPDINMCTSQVLIGTLSHVTCTVHFHYVTNKSDRAIK